jgi:hypothetical protein
MKEIRAGKTTKSKSMAFWIWRAAGRDKSTAISATAVSARVYTTPSARDNQSHQKQQRYRQGRRRTTSGFDYERDCIRPSQAGISFI